MKNCRIECTESGNVNSFLTVGKIYNVNEIGNFVNDAGNNVNILFYKTLEELNQIFAPQFKIIEADSEHFIKLIKTLDEFKIQEDLEGSYTDYISLVKLIIEKYDRTKPVWEMKEELISIIDEF